MTFAAAIHCSVLGDLRWSWALQRFRTSKFGGRAPGERVKSIFDFLPTSAE